MAGVSRRKSNLTKEIEDTKKPEVKNEIQGTVSAIPSKRKLRGTTNEDATPEETQEDTKRLRRSSGRVKNIPNYSVQSKAKHGPAGPTSNSTIKIDNDSESMSSIYKAVANNHRVSISSKESKDDIKSKLATLINRDNRLTSELYHLLNYTSLVYYNPNDPHKSDHFNEFAQKYDIWPNDSNKAADDTGKNSSRRSRRGGSAATVPLASSSAVSGSPEEIKLKREIIELSVLQSKPVVEEEIKLEQPAPPATLVEVISEPSTPLRKTVKKEPVTETKKLKEAKENGKNTQSPLKSKAAKPVKGTPKKEKIIEKEKEKTKKVTKGKGKEKSIDKTKGKGKGKGKYAKRTGSSDNEEVEEIQSEPSGEDEEEEESQIEDFSEYEYGSDEEFPYTIPKSLKLITRPPKQAVTHPIHVTEPNFSSISEYLDSYITPIEEANNKDMNFDEYDEYLQNEYKLLDKIQEGLDNKVLRLDFNENIFRNVPNGTREPTMIKKNVLLHQQYSRPPQEPFRSTGGANTFTHHDHLLAQGMFSSKLIHDTRNSKIQKARRIAQMIEVHFKRLSQESERAAKEHERRKIKLARDTAKEVKKRWLLAVKAYKILEEREKERERIAKSKEQLSKILDHSTKVLGAQMSRKSVSETPNTPSTPREDGEEESEGDSDDDSNFGSNSDDEDDFSSSDEESESEEEKSKETSNGTSNGNGTVEDDSKLTVEQLKEKYKNLSEVKLNEEDQEGDDDSDSESASESARSDSDSSMDSQSDSSDMDSAEEEEEESEDEEIGGGSGLAALYGGGAAAPVAEKVSIVDQMTEEERQKLFADDQNEHDSVLDSDDSSSSSSSSSDGESDEAQTKLKKSKKSKLKSKKKSASGLASLMNYNENEEDSDDDSVYSEPEEKETPGSSPDNGKKDTDEDDQLNSIVDVPTPSLLRGKLRIYQKQGLNWLASLYNNGTNGILADEMGLGKTIQTISLISYLACEKNIWGPHLIIVPTSVMLNWEMEFKRFAPGFKVLTYYGSPQQRKEKRKGWNTPDTFHVCITSYQLVVQDQQVFKRKKWKYMILDEAHNIKNFRSQRWKALLNFNTENRLLLTGTPLQNNIMELWSLLYFLMPSSRTNNEQTMPDGFANLMDFQQWFGRPVDKIIQAGGGLDGFQNDDETKKTVAKLHQVLRPYLLRRLKADVEKQMPAKYEHIVYCRLSNRQRLLYDDFMSRAQTKETLASGNFLSIINCLMQLRKVCNHPDLFEVRQILTSLSMEKSIASDFLLKELVVRKNLNTDYDKKVDLNFLNMVPTSDCNLNSFNVQSVSNLSATNVFLDKVDEFSKIESVVEPSYDNLERYYEYLQYREQVETSEIFKQRAYVNRMTCSKKPLMTSNLQALLTIRTNKDHKEQLQSLGLTHSVVSRSETMYDLVEKYSFVTPSVVTQDLNEVIFTPQVQQALLDSPYSNNPFHHSQVKLSIAFPDKSLLQFDCGKLQKLAVLLHDLTSKGHRALIFTQMTKVLDILEQFLNIHGYRYMRLDGSTKIEDRQLLTERFNKDSRISAFILSTRSGGLGINLTGADTVIFYDSDWNPAMDKQCQDRCHRIGQTRDVHIYRFVSEYTIESNILRKANQKRQLDNVIIQEGDFTTDYFGKLSVKDLLGEEASDGETDGANGSGNTANERLLLADTSGQNLNAALAQAEDEDDAAAANAAMKEIELDNNDFDDGANGGSGTASGGSSNRATPGPSSKGDDVSFGKKRVESGVTSSTSTASVGGAEDMEVDEKVDLDADANAEIERELQARQKNTNDAADEYEEEEDDDFGHVDEYMIRFIAGGYYPL